MVSEEGISIDPAKVKDILEWTILKNVSEIRGFLGITRWYKIFIRDYALIASPLTNLLKKGLKFVWTPEHQANLDELKRIITSAPCLKLLDFTKEFEAVIDASGTALGGVIVQEGRPIAFTLQKLKTYEANYATHDLELLAVIRALKTWRHYLLG